MGCWDHHDFGSTDSGLKVGEVIVIEVALEALDDLLQAPTQDVGLILTDTLATYPAGLGLGPLGPGGAGHRARAQEPGSAEFFVKVRRGKEDRSQLAHGVVAGAA